MTSCVFEYGRTSSYGSTVACSSLPGSGTGSVEVSAAITGLIPASTYHYRIVASNADGTSYGEDQSFTTVLPELGRCVQLSRASGVYKNSVCTQKSIVEDTSKYEWQPWQHADSGFSATTGSATIETAAKTTVKCTAGFLSGEYDGPQSVALMITFMGCEATGALGGGCQSEGASSGEIKTVALSGQLGVIKAGVKPAVGWELKPAAGTDLATFRCGSAEATLTGSVIAPVTPVDKMSVAFTLKFKAKQGKQSPESFEGGPKDTLTLTTPSGSEAAGLTGTLSMSGEEAIEVKAIE